MSTTKHRLLPVTFTLASIILHSSAAVADNCPAEILKYDVKIDFSDVKYLRYVRDTMCVMTFEEFSQKYGAETGAQYFAISGFGNFNSDNYKLVKSTKCHDRSDLEASSALGYSFDAIVPTEARKIAADCAKDIRLSCELKSDAGAPSLLVHYNTNQTGKSIVDDILLQNTTLQSSLRKGGRIREGTTPAAISVNDVQKSSKITISVEQNDGIDTCSVFLPPEQQCTQKLDGAVEKTFQINTVFGGFWGKKNPLVIDLKGSLNVDKLQVLARDWGCPNIKIGGLSVHACGKVDHAAVAVYVDGKEVGFQKATEHNSLLEFPVNASTSKVELRSLHQNRYPEGDETLIEWVRVVTKPTQSQVCE